MNNDIIKYENIPNSVKRASGVTIYDRERWQEDVTWHREVGGIFLPPEGQQM